jgi:hypothetical protein
MTSSEKFKCDFCKSVLSNKANRDSHIKRNKSCLKKRGIDLSNTVLKSCLKCGFTSTNIERHVCRSEYINMINEIKLLHTNINNTNKKLEKSEAKFEFITEKFNSDIVNLERDYSLTISELKVRIEKYENKIF